MVWLLPQRKCKYSSCRCYPKKAQVPLNSINQILKWKYLSLEISDLMPICKTCKWFSIPQASVPNESSQVDLVYHGSGVLLLRCRVSAAASAISKFEVKNQSQKELCEYPLSFLDNSISLFSRLSKGYDCLCPLPALSPSHFGQIYPGASRELPSSLAACEFRLQ